MSAFQLFRNSRYPFIAFVLVSASKAALILDTFDESGFVISSSGSEVAFPSGVVSDFVEEREAGIVPRRVGVGIAMAGVDSTLGKFSMNVDAPIPPISPVAVVMGYNGGGPLSLLGYTGFEFDFVNLTGEGTLVTGLGFSGVISDSRPRTIIEEGTLFVPLENAIFGHNDSLDSFGFIGFTFEARTEQFSFELEEIRIIPEPSSVAFSGVALLLCLRRKRRG
ncbi:MAG: hypothetical protein ACSHYF_05175 [Verrucomicrobiaceae bacterium]